MSVNGMPVAKVERGSDAYAKDKTLDRLETIADISIQEITEAVVPFVSCDILSCRRRGHGVFIFLMV